MLQLKNNLWGIWEFWEHQRTSGGIWETLVASGSFLEHLGASRTFWEILGTSWNHHEIEHSIIEKQLLGGPLGVSGSMLKPSWNSTLYNWNSTSESAWGQSQRLGSIWKLLETSGSFWDQLEASGNIVKLLSVLGSFWIHLGASGSSFRNILGDSRSIIEQS